MTSPTIRRSPDFESLLASVDGLRDVMMSHGIASESALAKTGADALVADHPHLGDLFEQLRRSRDRAGEARGELFAVCQPARRAAAQAADGDALTEAASAAEYLDPGRPAEDALDAEIEAKYRYLVGVVGAFRSTLAVTQEAVAELRQTFTGTLDKQIGDAKTKARKAAATLAESAAVIERQTALREWLPALGRTGPVAWPELDSTLSRAVADVVAHLSE